MNPGCHRERTDVLLLEAVLRTYLSMGIKEGRNNIPSSWPQTASSQTVFLSDAYTAQSLHPYRSWKQDVCGRDQGASSRTLRPHRPVE